MSFLAVEWALQYSATNDPYERLILTAMAQKAESDGTNAYRSKSTLADMALCDQTTVKRRIAELIKRGVIREGDQRAAAHIPAYKRPKVYDLLIPCSFYSAAQLEKVNADRAERDLDPITPANRPDLGAPPPRKERADKGVKRGPRVGAAKSRGGASSHPGASSTPLPEDDDVSAFDPGASSPGVLEAPNEGATSTPTLSSNAVPSSSPATPPSADPAAPVVTEEEKIAARTETTPAPGSSEPDAKPTPVEQIRAAWVSARLTAGFGPHRKRGAADEFDASATLLLNQGKPLPWLIDLAQWMGSKQAAWWNLDGATGAQSLGAPTEPKVPGQRTNLTKCPECDPYAPVPTHYRDPANGLGPFRCPVAQPAAA